MSKRELFHNFGGLESIAHEEFATLPTPVMSMPNTARHLGLEALTVKRDDLSGSLYGGNKVRKLEFLLADARAHGHDMVWTVGGIGSHHCLATCIWARELGMRCGVVHFPQPITPHVQKNIKALSTTRPEVHLLATEVGLSPAEFGKRMREWRDANPDAYYIPGGGSSPIGALGYVNAALEFVAQVERGEAPRPDVIVVAAGTCGTLAGLYLGFQLADFDVEVHGVRVVDDFIANPATVERLAQGSVDLLRAAGVDVPDFDPSVIRIDEGFFGADYGVPTEEGLAAKRLAGELDGLTLEPTYTAKAFAALCAMAPSLAERGQHAMYWHTLSGADLSERVGRADLDALPAEYRTWATQKPDWENG